MFVISTKIDYGVLMMVELAKTLPGTFLALSDIAKKRNISEKYLSQLIQPLKQAGFVASKEGSSGGYRLAKSARQISLQAIIEALDGPIQLVRCLEDKDKCPANHHCVTQSVWRELQQDITKLLAHKTLHDIL